MQNGVGIDLGATVIRVATLDDGLLAKEPSLVAVDKNSARILTLGEDAAELSQKNAGVLPLRPFTKGLLSRKNMTRFVLSEILAGLPYTMPAALNVPCNCTTEEAEALLGLFRETGFSSASLVYTPIAVLTGFGLSLDTDLLLIHIGAVSTEICLFLNGRIAYMESSSVAGMQMDRAVSDYLLTERQLRVAPSAAETLKKRIGCAWAETGDTPLEVRISGENVIDGQTKVISVTSEELMTAFEKPVAALVERICNVLRRVPLSKVEGMFQNGIYLSGGGSTLRGLDRLIGALTGVHTTLLRNPEDLAVIGLSRIAALSASDVSEAATLSRLSFRTM